MKINQQLRTSIFSKLSGYLIDKLGRKRSNQEAVEFCQEHTNEALPFSSPVASKNSKGLFIFMPNHLQEGHKVDKISIKECRTFETDHKIRYMQMAKLWIQAASNCQRESHGTLLVKNT